MNCYSVAGRSSRGIIACLVLSLACVIVGCTWQKPAPLPQDKAQSARSVTVHLPPKELVKRLQEKLPAELQLPIESVQDGVVFTGWKEYEGAVHIVRRWRERSRFKIVITPDFNDPTGTSHVEVFDETEEKPSDAQPWYPNPDLKRPERTEEVAKVIEGLK